MYENDVNLKISLEESFEKLKLNIIFEWKLTLDWLDKNFVLHNSNKLGRYYWWYCTYRLLIKESKIKSFNKDESNLELIPWDGENLVNVELSFLVREKLSVVSYK